MSHTLDDLLQQTRSLLVDEDGNLWSTATLTECARLGLAALQTICPLKLSLAGMDEAEITLLDGGMPAVLLRLTAWYAWQIRRQQRQEIYHPDPPSHAVEGQWLLSEEKALQQELETLRRSYLQRSTQVPYAPWPLEKDD